MACTSSSAADVVAMDVQKEAPPSLMSQLPPSDQEQAELDRAAKIQDILITAAKCSPSETFPWANYISQLPSDSYMLKVDPDSEVVPLSRTQWIPLPVHLLQDDMRPYLNSLATRLQMEIANQQHFVCFPMFTPSLLMRLSCRPGLMNVMELRSYEKTVSDAYEEWELANRSDPNRHKSTEALHAVQSIMAIRKQEARALRERCQFEDVTWPRHMSSSKILGHYLRAKHLVIATCGFSSRIDTSEGNVDTSFHKLIQHAEKILDAKLRRIVDQFYADNYQIDKLVLQVLEHGQVDNIGAHLDTADLEKRLVTYTISVIRAVESWFLAATGLTDERLHNYHQSAFTVPKEGNVPQAVMRECMTTQAWAMQQQLFTQPYLWRRTSAEGEPYAHTVRYDEKAMLFPAICGKSTLASYAYAIATSKAPDVSMTAFRDTITRQFCVASNSVDLSAVSSLRIYLPAETPDTDMKVIYSTSDA